MEAILEWVPLVLVALVVWQVLKRRSQTAAAKAEAAAYSQASGGDAHGGGGTVNVYLDLNGLRDALRPVGGGSGHRAVPGAGGHYDDRGSLDNDHDLDGFHDYELGAGAHHDDGSADYDDYIRVASRALPSGEQRPAVPDLAGGQPDALRGADGLRAVVARRRLHGGPGRISEVER